MISFSSPRTPSSRGPPRAGFLRGFLSLSLSLLLWYETVSEAAQCSTVNPRRRDPEDTRFRSFTSETPGAGFRWTTPGGLFSVSV